jgi:undecaprenyl pyrophosphate phosphatase UppP
MTDQTQQAPVEESAPEAADQASGSGASLLDKVVLALCAVGVVVAMVIVFDYSDLTLFDGHAADVIADAWNRNATIGLIVAIVVAIGVGLFVYALAKSTLGSTKVPGEPSDDH